MTNHSGFNAASLRTAPSGGREGGLAGWQSGGLPHFSQLLLSCMFLHVFSYLCCVDVDSSVAALILLCVYTEKTESASGARRFVSNQARCLAFTCHVSALPSHASWLSWSLAACCIALLCLTFTREPQKAGAWRSCRQHPFGFLSAHLTRCLWQFLSRDKSQHYLFPCFFLCPTEPWNTFLVVCSAPYFLFSSCAWFSAAAAFEAWLRRFLQGAICHSFSISLPLSRTP